MRFGVIGTNWITERFIEAAREHPDFALTAVYSRTEERARAFAAAHECPHAFADLEAMARSDALDAVYIASPNSFHAEQAVLCMKHGKHVLCEKPIGSNAREMRAMIAAAQANDALLMEAMKSTLQPNFRAIRDHVHKIGRVRRYTATYCQYSSRYDAYKSGALPNAFNPVYSNGSLMDLGIYCLYPLVVLFGKPERVQAGGVLLESGVDGEGSLLLAYRDMEAVITHSKISSSYAPAEIQGEDGTIVIDKINHLTSAEIRYRDGSVEPISQPQTHASMYYEVAEFIELWRSGRRQSETNSHANSLAALEVMDEARRQIGLVFPADAAAIGESVE